MGYIFSVIKTFKHKGLENYFYSSSKKGIQAQHARKLSDILDSLDASNELNDMNYPGSNLHELKGKMKGRWSVQVSGNWRITFRFKEGCAYDVNYEDYH